MAGVREDEFEAQKVGYRWLRRAIGVLGIALPLALTGICRGSGNGCVSQLSISDYYHTDLRFLFVTILVLLAVLFFAYPGYDEDDDFAAHLAGLFTMGVVIFPTNRAGTEVDVRAWLHLGSAAAMFLLLAIICLSLFRRTAEDRKKGPPAKGALAGALGFWKLPKRPAPAGSRKATRNRLFAACGWVIIACIVTMIAYMVATRNTVQTVAVVWWCETIGLVAFGVAWMVKGDMLLADERPEAREPPPGGG